MTQGIQEQGRTLSAIEAECHLVQVGRKMFGADLVPVPHDAALQKRECGFNGIGRDARATLVADIFSSMMIDCLVVHFANRILVGRECVGNEHVNIGAYILANVFCQRTALGIFGTKESQSAAALPDADNNFFRFFSGAWAATSQLAANIRLVHFDSTVKHGLIYFLHGRTNSMAKIPSRLVGTFVLAPNRALELHRTHSLLGFAEQQNGEEPLLQRQMGIIEDRSSGDGELIVARFAVEELLGCLQFNDGHLAAHAFNAAGPAQTHQNLAAFFVGVKQVDNVN